LWQAYNSMHQNTTLNCFRYYLVSLVTSPLKKFCWLYHPPCMLLLCIWKITESYKKVEYGHYFVATEIVYTKLQL
jgi:hypothetical protein